MHNHIAVIKYEPTFLGLSLDASLFLVKLFACVEYSFCKRVEHAVAGTVANHKIISKRCDVFDVKKQDVFALFVLQGGDDFMCKFECVQISPHDVIARTLRGLSEEAAQRPHKVGDFFATLAMTSAF